MKKAMLNYWIDVATGAALLVCALTGIVRLFPAAVDVSSGSATVLGVSSALWTTIHDWSGVVMVAGAALHTVLHLRWLAHMTKKVVRGPAEARTRVVAPAQVRARVTVPAAAPQQALNASPQASEAASLARLEAMDGRRDRRDERRGGRPGEHTMSRKAFLYGAAAVGGAALLAGAGVLRSGSDTAVASSTVTDATSTGTTSSSSDTSNSATSSSDTSSSAQTSTADASSTSTASTARVVVDSGACVGCDQCLQVCPHGVFTLEGGKAFVGDAGACSLCGHCLQVCRPQAITLNG